MARYCFVSGFSATHHVARGEAQYDVAVAEPLVRQDLAVAVLEGQLHGRLVVSVVCRLEQEDGGAAHLGQG